MCVCVCTHPHTRPRNEHKHYRSHIVGETLESRFKANEHAFSLCVFGVLASFIGSTEHVCCLHSKGNGEIFRLAKGKHQTSKREVKN